MIIANMIKKKDSKVRKHLVTAFLITPWTTGNCVVPPKGRYQNETEGRNTPI